MQMNPHGKKEEKKTLRVSTWKCSFHKNSSMRKKDRQMHTQPKKKKKKNIRKQGRFYFLPVISVMAKTAPLYWR